MTFLPKNKHLVQVNYKSGNTLELLVFDFKTKRDSEANLTSVSWDFVDPDFQMLHAGLNDIESIIKIKSSRWL
jgi:hypothetical protein